MTRRCTMDSCFGTLDLRTASLICAYVNIICHILITTVYLLALPSFVFGFVLLAVDVAFIALNVIFIVVLLVGLHARVPGAMNVYIVYSYMFFAFCFFMFIVYIVLYMDLFLILLKLVSLCFTAFFWFVTRSYFLSLEDVKTDAPPAYNNAI